VVAYAFLGAQKKRDSHFPGNTFQKLTLFPKLSLIVIPHNFHHLSSQAKRITKLAAL
jgi:hypothetical protein